MKNILSWVTKITGFSTLLLAVNILFFLAITEISANLNPLFASIIIYSLLGEALMAILCIGCMLLEDMF